MKKYLFVCVSYLEADGIDASVDIFDTEEEAQKHMEEVSLAKANDIKDIEWNNRERNSFSVGGYDEYSQAERYDGFIEEKDI